MNQPMDKFRESFFPHVVIIEKAAIMDDAEYTDNPGNGIPWIHNRIIFWSADVPSAFTVIVPLGPRAASPHDWFFSYGSRAPCPPT